MARQTKSDIIREREAEMSAAAFAIMLVIRYGNLSRSSRADMMQVHFNLSYRYAEFENHIEDICRRVRRKKIAQQPGPWPADHFEARP